MKEHQKKIALKQKIEASLYTLYSVFKKIPFAFYTYALAKILQNRAKFKQKQTPGFKNQKLIFVPKIFRLSTAQHVKVHRIPNVIFQIKN